LIFVSVAVLPPIAEEIIARGFLFEGLKRSWGKRWAAVVVSLLFAMAHLGLGSGTQLIWLAAVDTFGLSFVLVWLREKTGGLTAPIGLHMLKNTIAFVYLFVLTR
jgi:membrane protease YdiL (CAAX protease family)